MLFKRWMDQYLFKIAQILRFSILDTTLALHLINLQILIYRNIQELIDTKFGRLHEHGQIRDQTIKTRIINIIMNHQSTRSIASFSLFFSPKT